jgi:YHS domain-containing protein
MKQQIVLIVALLFAPAFASGQDLTNIKCPINPKAAVKAETAVDYAGGKVWFCCKNCAGKFTAKPEDFAVMANHQLVATGQYTQKACPITGRPAGEGIASDVGGVSVGLCCKNCKGKVDGAEALADKAAIAFSAEAFAKGFEAAASTPDLSNVTCMMMPEEKVSADSFVEYRGGKVWFCCDDCKEAFSKDTEKFAAMANMQLVQTGQFAQTNCPLTGRDVPEGMTTKVGSLDVGVCCNGCKGKVEKAADDKARVEMVFADKAFADHFAPKK